MQNAKRARGTFSILLSAFAAPLLTACSRRPSAPAPKPPTAAQRSAADTLPSRSAYAGSEACGECHRKNYDRWRHDWHARAFAEATPRSVVGRFDGAHFRGDSSEAWVLRKGGSHLMRTHRRDRQLRDYPL